MKYIRVKDMSHEWLTTFVDYDNARNKATELGLTYSLKIVKQADSIEELCDAYVRVFIKKCDVWEPIVLRNKDDKTLILLEHEDYAAIWTDKGLIYVAKTNDKGELELL